MSALTRSRLWHKTALFITWDEHGGYYDHVPPPTAIEPDNIAPITNPDRAHEPERSRWRPGGYNRYGFRVPLLVISPWARSNYVSSVVQDHTSILAFIERKWNLPALTLPRRQRPPDDRLLRLHSGRRSPSRRSWRRRPR